MMLIVLESRMPPKTNRGNADFVSGHEGECYSPEIRSYLEAGRKRYLANCSIVECINRNGTLFLSFQS